MARPSKPVSVIKNEKKAHRTKAELKQREKSEQAMLSGYSIREFAETKADKRAHEEFIRVCDLMGRIEKNDAIYETVINRYCQIISECVELKKRIKQIEKNANNMRKQFDDNIVSSLDITEKADYCIDFAKAINQLTKTQISCENEIQSKRTMLLAIEKECGMTLAAALRSVPKKAEEKKSALLEVLQGGGG